ncbi:MAG: type I 3-dehydroquinate dehydratase [Planctomyces sp.]|nr:type I 3-dehydroquinate dehydratase [Planctomyces sp.]
MICISVTPTSRTLAPADLLNASRQGDLIELCLDHFLKEPNIGELIKAVDKPILISCRRPQDGGQWNGTESERLQLLRSAIVSGPAYVELDLDIAPGIPRFGSTKRVISFTSLNRPLGKIDEIFEKCQAANADIVKVTWPTDNLDAAWPLLAAVTQPRALPVVGFGVGRSGTTFSLLGRRYGSPWIYAALERGMEAFEQQPTVWQLKEEYHFEDINSKTRFLGIVGYGTAENTAARVLNAAFQELDKPIRCLPLIPGDVSRLPKMLSTMKINGLIIDPAYMTSMSTFAGPGDETAQKTGCMDVLTERKDGWKGVSTLMQAIDVAGQQVTNTPEWASRGSVLVIGHTAFAKAAALYFGSKGAAVSLASSSDNSAAGAARETGVRLVTWNAAHDVRADTLIIAERGLACGTGKGELNPMIIRERMNVVDLTSYPQESAFVEEALARGARLISPSAIFASQLQMQFKLLAGRELPGTAFEAAAGM